MDLHAFLMKSFVMFITERSSDLFVLIIAVCLFIWKQMDFFLFGANLAHSLLAEDALAAVHTVPLSVCHHKA